MKITQLDYTAIRAANAAQAQANSAAIAVESMGQTNRTVAFNNKELNRQSTLEWVEFGFDTVGKIADFGLDLYSKVKERRVQADTESAGLDISGYSGDLVQRVNESLNTDKGSYFDEDSNIVMPEYWNEWKQQDIEAFKAKGYDKSVTEAGIRDIERTYQAAWQDIRGQLYQTETANLLESFSDKLDLAYEADSKTGNADVGRSMIENASFLSPSDKAVQLNDYDRRVELGYNSSQIAAIAAGPRGTAGALEYVNGLDVSPEDKQYYLGLARQYGTEGDKDAVSRISGSVQQSLQSGMTPLVILQQLEPEIEQMEPERQAKVEKAVNQLFYDNMLERLNYPDDITTISGSQLKQLETNYNAFSLQLMPGTTGEARTLREAVGRSIDAEKKRRNEANADANISDFDAIIESAGVTISPAEALRQIMDTDVSGTWGAEDDQKLAEVLSTLGDKEKFVPKQHKPLYDQLIKSYETMVTDVMNLDFKDPDEVVEATRINQNAISYFLDYFWYTDPQDITIDGIMDAYDKSMDLFFGDNAQRLEKLYSKQLGRTMIQESTSGYSASFLDSFTQIASEAPEGAIRKDPDTGEYIFGIQGYQRGWEEQMVALTNILQSMGYEEGGWSFRPDQKVNADGTSYDIPILVADMGDGTQYRLMGTSLQQKKSGGPWNSIRDIESFQNPQEYRTPISTDAPRNVLPDGEGGFIDETMLSPEENNLLSMVSELEQERPAEAPAVPETAKPVEQQETEPEIPVRRVEGVGPQFWYQGNWYLVDDLTEGSEVLRAYDRFIETFNGKWPRVRK